MEYTEFTDYVKQCEFIEGSSTADSAVKAVLGVVASTLDEDDVQKLTDSLPEPLDLEKLRGHQARPLRITVPQLIEQIREQFKLKNSDASRLILTVLYKAESAVQDESLKNYLNGLIRDVKSTYKSGRWVRESRPGTTPTV